jgi:hypothetical protein
MMQAVAVSFQALTRALSQVLALDLGALYCLGCAALYGYRAYNDQVRPACACRLRLRLRLRAVSIAAALHSKPDAFCLLRCAGD